MEISLTKSAFQLMKMQILYREISQKEKKRVQISIYEHAENSMKLYPLSQQEE